MRAFLIVAASVAFVGLSHAEDTLEPFFRKKAAQADIVALSYRLDAPDVSDRAKRIVAEHESEYISSIFDSQMRGGLGVGSLMGENFRGGVQHLVMRWRHVPPSPEKLASQRQDALQVARVIRAMAELAPHRKPKSASPERSKEWDKVAAEFRASALGFHNALKGTEPDAIKAAAKRLHATCCHCHCLID